MKALITIFKTELAGKNVDELLHGLYDDVTDIGDALIYRPSSGKLFQFLNVLRVEKIAYGTHFDTSNE